MKITSIAFGLIASALLAGCSGGGSGGSYSPPPVHQTPAPPGPSPTGGAVLATAVINGGPAFVNSAQHAVYTSDGDSNNMSNCNAGCAGIWPPVSPPSASLSAPWASFKRADGSTQLSYNGKPLYTFVNDTQPLVANGDGVNGFHLARPASTHNNGVPPGNPGYVP